MRSVLVGVLAVLAAQLPPPQPPTFRLGVDVVQVDVSVLDKDRRPVGGLTQSDFTILEDGKPRPIVAFGPVELEEPSREQPSAPWVRDVAPDVMTNRARPEGRLVVIMFDWSIRFEDQLLAQRIGRAAVDQLGPDDLAAVVFSSGFANGGVPQNFTADRARLLAAVNQTFAMALHNPPNGPGHDPRNGNLVMIDDPEGYESGDCHCRVCVPEAIARVADAVRDVQGRRKTLLFIGTYFRMYEALQGPQSRQRPEFKPGLGGKQVIYPGECSLPLKSARDKMARAISLANLTIHSVDAVGVETEMNSPMGGSAVAIRERQDDLRALADMTGGRTVMNTGAPEEHLRDVFGESHSYYLLAFAPADRERSGKYHKIDVKVNRPGVTVRTRSGYYAGETRVAGNKPSAMSPEAVSALEGILPRNGVALTVSAAPFAASGKPDATVAIVLGVRHEVRTDPPGDDGSVKVLAAAFDRNGRSVNSEQQTVGITLPSHAADDVPFDVLSRLALKPGRYELRIALDEAAGKSGSVYTFVDVPDFAERPVSLSGVVLSVAPSWPAAPSQGFPDLLPIVPTSRREFASTDHVSAFVRVYQRLKEAAQSADVRAQILDRNGRVVTTDATSLDAAQFARTRSADYRIRLPVDRLTAGEYLLTLNATRGGHTVDRRIRFRVR
jgi:VWFA-related protein